MVVRIRIELTGTGLVATRACRALHGHSYSTSMGTDVSQLSNSMRGVSIADTSSSYQPTDAVDEYPVEYRSVPWSAEGKGRRHLTVRLALFYLACMAGIGGNKPQPGYPSLDSSWYQLDGACIHNTTGLVSKKPKRLEYPDPSGERGPRWETFEDDDGGETMEYLTLCSVLTLDVVEHEGRSYYYYIEEEQRVLISTDMPIYDVDNEQFGYFKGVAWRVGNSPESTSKHSKHSKSHSKSSNRQRKRRK